MEKESSPGPELLPFPALASQHAYDKQRALNDIELNCTDDFLLELCYYLYLSLVSELRKRFEGITTSASDSAMNRYEGGDLWLKWL